MNWNEIVKVIETEVFNKTERHLKEVESIVLQGTWQGKTYEQMEETCQYSLSYLKQAAGPRLWKLLSEVLGEDIGKTNFRVVLERWSKQQPASSKIQVELLAKNKATQKQDWGEAPVIPALYGRDRDLKLLNQWIVKDRCRLVTIFGMGGIGKTALSIRFAQQIQAQFDCVIWRSLHYVPGAAELVDDLLKSFNSQPERIIEENLDGKISSLIEHLRRDKCLIVLDTAAEIWQSGDLAGHYRQQYKGYGELLRRLGAESHQSCLLLCTREKPREIALLEGKKVPVYSLHLNGLATQAQYIFRDKGLSDTQRWDELIQLYRGNPLALKIVATTIQELFSGSVSAFLQQDTIVYGDIYDLLDEQFERLSNSEQEILNWLAIACQPLSLIHLQSNILLPFSTAELIEALESLVRRSLIVRTIVNGSTWFSLHQPVVAQYVISRSIDWVCEEITEVNNSQDFGELKFLRNYALTSDDAEIHQRQINQIVTPIKNKLYRIFQDESLLKACLQEILLSLREKTPLAVGYVKRNIETLLKELHSDLDNQVSVSP
ncbi:NB-ARC domain-containing protein [Pleurocapsa sp. FMAR1]|uniref:NB-ARC domain-containing protein n=1 Tax=Pleurocapsa sp. FMAR1 TaxID=3040204 RepID=UPI0029C71B08|nr:NB-ARC domain-containing protein [Pleurocapsa sp. FMAR1]